MFVRIGPFLRTKDVLQPFRDIFDSVKIIHPYEELLSFLKTSRTVVSVDWMSKFTDSVLVYTNILYPFHLRMSAPK